MSNQFNKPLIRFIIAIGIILFISACNGRPKGVLNQSEMTEVLTDMHLVDGSYAVQGLGSDQNIDKSVYYTAVLNKHGVTQAEFDSSLVWYTKNPKKFEKIYNEVLVQLTNRDKDVKKGMFHPVDSVELAKVKAYLWDKRTRYNFTKDSTHTRLDFVITNSGLLMGDVYILKMLQRIAPQDSSTKQHVVLRINYANGKVDSAYAVAHNDSLLRRYTLHLPALRKLKIKSISGELLGNKVYKGKMGSTLDSITLIRVYNPKMQDSIRKMLEKANPAPRVIHKKMSADSLRRKVTGTQKGGVKKAVHRN